MLLIIKRAMQSITIAIAVHITPDGVNNPFWKSGDKSDKTINNTIGRRQTIRADNLT